MTITTFKELVVWQKGMSLAKEIYKATESLPQKEVFGLISQMRRAAVSIPSNIAEGRQRSTRRDFAQFLRIALGSSAELETQILLSNDIYPSVDFKTAEHLLTEVQKMLSVMLSKLAANS